MNLSSNIPKLYAFSALKMALFPMAIITLFWKDHIGLSLAQILLLQGIFSAATLLLEYPSGYLSDRLGYRFSLSLASVLGIAGWGIYLVAGSFGEVLAAEILLGTSYAFISGSDSALLFETLSAEGQEHHYARLEGRMTGFAQGGEAAGALFAGTLYGFFPLLPFIIQILIWVLALTLTRSLREPQRPQSEPPSSHLAEALATARYALVENRRLRTLILWGTLLGLCSFYPVWLIQPHMQEQGVPLAWFGPVWAGANMTVAIFSVISHRVHFHLGDKGMAILFLVLVVTGYLGLGWWGGEWIFLCYYLHTAMRGLQGPMLRNLIQLESRSGNRASILSLKSLLFRLGFVLTGPAVGLLADREGLPVTFLLLALILGTLLLPLTLLALRELGVRRGG